MQFFGSITTNSIKRNSKILIFYLTVAQNENFVYKVKDQLYLYSLNDDQINASIWKTACLCLPQSKINPNLLSLVCYQVKGGLGVFLLRYWHWSTTSIVIRENRHCEMVTLQHKQKCEEQRTLQWSQPLYMWGNDGGFLKQISSSLDQSLQEAMVQLYVLLTSSLHALE